MWPCDGLATCPGCASPDDRWDRLQPPCDPTDGLDGIENGWMDGCVTLCIRVCVSLCLVPVCSSTFLSACVHSSLTTVVSIPPREIFCVVSFIS